MVASRAFVAAAASLLLPAAHAQDADGKYEISAEGIRANFIAYGASISNLFINDTNGVERDIVLGFDNASYYGIDKLHPHLGGVPGRYANRIKNSTFEIDGVTYHVDANENGGLDTLHGGSDGWDWRNFTVEAHTENSITFSLLDPDGDQGFPGAVKSYITYTLTPYAWHLKMYATALTKKTPIMLSSHTYWNLDGFANNETATALNHTLSLPYSGQRIGTDGILIPNGTILPNQKGSVNDFWSAPKQIGASFNDPEIVGNCGTGCSGYDTCYIVNRAQDGPYDWRTKGPVASLSSDFSGIKVDVFTDQDAFQVYSCGGQNGTLTLKKTQGLFDDPDRPRVVEQYGCVVMEVEDWIDGINQPEWQRDSKQIFGPEDPPYVLEAIYKFSVGDASSGGCDKSEL
ncbi:aldose 1-epimerase [Diplodia corticola]|uniref:Aldose 1-epimerase n=1 Tax=Diplodia corticola TaxID=236234 RepID=A0A1J9RS78_9PEZI|nr:aldose 1-epimerase [Diplodia corticola]OJD31295.1 aldose 1-epimerase [Diplodia corticola]